MCTVHKTLMQLLRNNNESKVWSTIIFTQVPNSTT